jgi:hypothetical protein
MKALKTIKEEFSIGNLKGFVAEDALATAVTLIAIGIVGLYIFEQLQPQLLAEIIENLTSALLVVAIIFIATIICIAIIWAIYSSNS